MRGLRFSFDHLVHLVNDPNFSIQRFQQAGVCAQQGGRHEQWGTFNSLCYFGLSYIEFLGVDNPELAALVCDNDLAPQAMRELPEKEGLARVAIRTDNIKRMAEKVKKLGYQVTGPFAGSRKRMDGTTLQWEMFFMEDNHGELALPFFIQWGQTDEQRREDLLRQSMIVNHPLGQLSLAHVAFAVRDLTQATARWSALLDIEATRVFMDQSLQAKCSVLPLAGAKLLFCAPDGKGIVSEMLRTRGERPFLASITGADKAQAWELQGAMYQFRN